MVCKNCGSEELQYDEVSGMYYCPNCNTLLNMEEESEDYSLEEDEEEEASDWTPTDLNGFVITILNILATVPILSLFVPMILSNSTVKDEYKKFFCYRFISQLLMVFALVFLGMAWYKNYDVKTQISYKDCLMSIVNIIDTIKPKDVQSLNTEVKGVSEVVDIEEPNMVDTLKSDNLNLFDGAIIDGEKAISIIESTQDYKLTYLMQSFDVAERHGENTYRVVGYLVNGSYTEDTASKVKPYFVEDSETYSFYTDDYGEYVHCSISDLENDRYIFYINPSYYYKMRVLYSDDGNVIGFSFREV